MDRKKFRQLKLLRDHLDAESREIHESGLRIDRKVTVRGRKSSFTSILLTFTAILPTFSTYLGS